MHKNHKAREATLKLLYEYEISKNSMEKILNRRDFFEPKEEDLIKFSKELFLGVIQNLEKIDDLIQRHTLNWKVERLAILDKNILRIGTYELLFHPETPAAIIIDDAVELAKIYGDEEAPKFINGILDNILHKELKGRVVKT